MTGLIESFDVCGPLPEGTTVLEASAGTGKTFTIAALAVRYVAEGVARLDELMLVTFGRAATAELRERVRERLVSAERGLRDPQAARSGDDEVLALLATGTPAQVAQRRQRLASALASFDAATIATTHSFCHQMLAEIGIAADVDHDVTFVDTTSDVVTEVVSDLYVRRFGRGHSEPPPISFDAAQVLARAAAGDRNARLEPRDAEDPDAAIRYRLGAAVRRELAHRKRQRRILDFDDLLTFLREALLDESTGEAARERLRSRYRIVLVDEFQDTDPVQWDILRLAFHGHTTLVLIGDPKQAIYAFRGADVVTYLSATETAGTERTLGTNWRSDAPLLEALGHLMGEVPLGDPRIVVRKVRAAHPTQRLTGAPVPAPLRLRIVGRDQVRLSQQGLALTASTRQLIACDVAADIVGLLGSGARLSEGDQERPIRPGDLAVLVQTNSTGDLVHDALVAAGVPVVVTGTTSVFLAGAARDWLILLQALEQPHRSGRARAAALGCFLGWSAERLAVGDEEALEELGHRLRRWADVLAARGVAALFEVAVTEGGLTARLLSTEDGERTMTDLRHIAQALHGAAVAEQLGPASLVTWLRRRMTEAGSDTSEERSRRLESDAAAVQIITVHRSKGLEFPVVYAPFLWDRHVWPKPDHLRLHDPDGSRVLDVGGPTGPEYAARKAVHAHEDAGEQLRLLYVALTRARCQVVTWWAPAVTAAASPLHRLLFGDRARDGQVKDKVPVPADPRITQRFAELVAAGHGSVTVEPVNGDVTAHWQPPRPAHPHLAARTFARGLDTTWGRTSYSGLTSAVHGEPPGVSSEADEPGVLDEPEPGVTIPPGAAIPPVAAAPGEETMRAVVSPMSALPGGAAFGTVVHEVMEHLDTSAPDLLAELVAGCRSAGSERFAGVPAETLGRALLPSLETPLGPLAGDLRLRDIAPEDRLAEMDFELPLLGGDRPTGEATVGQLAAVLRAHLPTGHRLAGYPDALDVPALASRTLRGYLTGSIDAVLRIRDEKAEPRYVVVDYKTNWLGTEPFDSGKPLTAWDYRPESLTSAMIGAHYPLQALLYSVALHRFLRWRQPGYAPERHLGGVLYLFTRGMCGPDTPRSNGDPCGVFSWTPSPDLVEDVSRLLAGGVR